MTPEQEARYAIDYGGEGTLSPEARAIYDTLTAPGYQAGDALPGDGRPQLQPGQRWVQTRTPPETRARILAMFKAGNRKYALPFEGNRLAAVSVLGGNWEEYGSIVLQMAILDTLLSVEEKLTERKQD